jgi:spore germination cell wall hydrolase CwlJ-like protein
MSIAVVLTLAALIIVAVAAFGNTGAAMSAKASGQPSSSPSVQVSEQTASPSPLISATPVITEGPAPSQAPEQTSTPKPSPSPKPTPTPVTIDLNELVNYYMVKADKYYNDFGFSSNSYNYTEDEVTMMAKVITREAGGTKYETQLAVGNVVMNRVLSGRFGKTIEAVVTAKHQFAYHPTTNPYKSCIKAALEVLKDERWVVPQNTYFFKMSKAIGKNWGSHVFYSKIGTEIFYTDKAGKRYNGKEIPPALFERVYKWPQYGCKPAKRVSRIQHMLCALGYKVSQDGYFGKTTKEQLIKFQKNKKLTADGVAGSATLKALIKAYGKEKYYKEYGK